MWCVRPAAGSLMTPSPENLETAATEPPKAPHYLAAGHILGLVDLFLGRWCFPTAAAVNLDQLQQLNNHLPENDY